VGAIAIKLQDPVFESQTKNKLGNTDVKGWIVGAVKDAVVDYMHRNLDEAQLIVEKVERNEPSARTSRPSRSSPARRPSACRSRYPSSRTASTTSATAANTPTKP
jgi:topoisomerase-4 subunit B